jgi:hypothetical protein
MRHQKPTIPLEKPENQSKKVNLNVFEFRTSIRLPDNPPPQPDNELVNVIAFQANF